MKRSFLLILALSLVLPAALFAQGVTTGAFAGKVVDIDGNPVMGAAITIVHEPTGTQYKTLTRADGRYNVPGVKVGGPYTVTASFEGFKTETTGDLVVKLGETKAVNFTLQLATVDAGEVVVTASDSVINPYRTGASQNVARDAIDNLPTISRSLSDFTRLAPQMVSNEETDGVFSAGGRNNRYNNVQIDGAQNNDLFGLGASGTPGGQAEATPISLEAVQEFQIVLAPYDVRQGMFTGGGVNIITKGGSNDFHGSVYWEGRNESLVGKGPSDTDFGEFSEGTYGLSIGGPLVRNKLFFFVSGEISTRKQPEDYYIDGSGAGYDFGHQAEADRFISIMQNYGYDVGGYDPVTNEKTSNKIFARLDWNLSERHRLTLRHNFVDSDLDLLSRDSTYSFNFGNAGIIYLNKTNSTVLQLNSVLGSNLHNELLLNYSTIRDNPTYMGEPFPKIEVSVGGVTFSAGSEEYRHKNELNQDLIEITDYLTLYKGKHTLIFGTHNELFKFYNVYVQRAFGLYEFDSLDDLENGIPSYYDRYFSLTGDPNAPAEFNVYQLGFFVGDEWAVNPNLTITLGLRTDVPFFPDDPPNNPLVMDKFGIPTDHNAGGNFLWSPRFGFNLDAGGNQNTQIRGGIGVFSGRTPYVWISNQYSNTGVDLGRYRVFGNPGFFVTDPDNQPPHPDPSAAPGDINLIDESYKFPQVFKTNFAIDQKLPGGFTGTVEFVYSKNINDVKFENINIAPTGEVCAFDGRPLYGTQSTTSSGGGRYGGTAWVNPEFQNVILLTNTSEGFSYQLSFQLQKEWRDGSMINASYTYGMSKDLFSGTSSRAISNWGYNITSGDPNNPDLTYSTHDTRHRIMFALTKRFDFFRNAPTMFSLFYNGRSGRPYSTIFYNDVNGDGRINDSAWIPASSDQVIITRGTWDDVNQYISGDPVLEKYRGQIVPRNASRDPWYHGIDFKIAQFIPLPFQGHKLELFFTVSNLLNLLNKDWSVYRYILFDDSPFTFRGYDAATGLPKIDFYGRTKDSEGNPDEKARYTINQLISRWKALLGIKYRF